MSHYLNRLRYILNVIRYFRNWPTAIRHRLGLQPNGGMEVFYRLRSGGVFVMQPGMADVRVVKESTGDHHLYEPIPEFQIQNGWRILDLGAHKGVFSIYAALSGTESLVYAVEPSSTNYQFLQRNLKLNAVNNVITKKAAVWTTTAEAALSIHEASWAHSLVIPGATQCSEYETVPTISLDALLDWTGGHLDLLKVDIEGAEYEVLMNANPATLRNIYRIVVEYHAIPSKSIDQLHAQLVAFLEESGFYCFPPAQLPGHILAIQKGTTKSIS